MFPLLVIPLILVIVATCLAVAVYVSIDSKKLYKTLKNKHVVITGGSSGIGKAAALEAARLGAHVTIIGRDLEKLKSSVQYINEKCSPDGDQKIQYVSLDITSTYEVIEKCLMKLESDIGPIFMLINCAGMCICGQFETMKPDDIKKMIDLNYFGTAYPTKFVLEGMKKRDEGIVVFVSTEGALLGIYGLSAYSGSKWAVRGLAEAIFMELVGTNVSLTLAFPPDTDTPGFETEQASKPMETKLISGTAGLQDPEMVGKQIVQDAMKRKSYSVFGWTGQLMSLLYCSSVESVGQVLCQVFFMGLLRAVFVGIFLSFYKIVRDGLKKRSEETVKTQ